jgi:hypothetical protein
MQEGLSPSPAWLHSAFGWIASFLTGATIFKLIDIWLNRKKPAAEVQVTEATATEITVRSHSTAGDAIIRMMTRLDEAQATIDRLRDQRDEWELKAFDLQVELKDARAEVGQLLAQARLDDHHIRKQSAFIEAKELKEEFIALDKPKPKPEPQD